MKKALSIFILAVILVGAGAFYGGIQYANAKKQSAGNNWQGANGQTGQRGAGVGSGQGFGRAMGNRGGMISGDIIAKDDKSITIKLRDGGSKIVFFANSTEISKFTAGATSDLEIGKSVTANGTTNSDGSVSAQMIQLRPNLSQFQNSSTTTPIK